MTLSAQSISSANPLRCISPSIAPILSRGPCVPGVRRSVFSNRSSHSCPLMSGETLVKCLQRVLVGSPEVSGQGESCGLDGREFLARSKCADYCGGRTTNRQHGPEQEVDAHRTISRLHLRNSRLTRADQLSHSALR